MVCTIASEPLNIYLGMQVCYQGQTASTLPSQQSHLPPCRGGVIARRKRQEEKKRGMQRHCNFICLHFSLHSPRADTAQAEETIGQQHNFVFVFFPASNISSQGKLTPVAIFYIFGLYSKFTSHSDVLLVKSSHFSPLVFATKIFPCG